MRLALGAARAVVSAAIVIVFLLGARRAPAARLVRAQKFLAKELDRRPRPGGFRRD
jgi:hypothetical protein